MLQKFRSFSFTKHFKIFACVSFLLVITGVVSLVLSIFGVNLFNFDVDFTGGTSCNFDLHQPVDRTVVETVTKITKDVTGASSVSVVSSNDGEGVLIKTPELDSETREALTKAVFEQYGMDANDESDVVVNSVSPSVGDDLKKSAVIASVLAVLLILVYIAIRFEWRSGLAAVCCLVHDLLTMLSMYVIFQIPFNTNFIAAALTILGYSINATIVVFDRVRENRRLAKPNESFASVVDRSIWDTFTRSLNTTITTLLVMLMLLILGVDSIRNFALPLCIGILCGCYSSVCVAGPLWNLFNGKKSK